MSNIKKIYFSILLSFILAGSIFSDSITYAAANDTIPFIILSKYNATMDVGNEINIMAVTTNGKFPTWKSSNSKVASVNTYGIITAKKPGSALITAKIRNAEASCYVTVKKTQVYVSHPTISMERGGTFQLSATTSNKSQVVWKSVKRSIASVDAQGMVTGLKPGITEIIATADGTSSVCKCTVITPTLKLNKTTASLYRGQSLRLSANVSSNITPTWKSNKKSVVTVNESGMVTAIKHGSATITATVDGVTALCDITVKQPTITLSATELTIKKGGTATISATVSSDNLPVWTTSNPNILLVSSKGEINALNKGKAYIYATEDGTKVRCTVCITE